VHRYIWLSGYLLSPIAISLSGYGSGYRAIDDRAIGSTIGLSVLDLLSSGYRSISLSEHLAIERLATGRVWSSSIRLSKYLAIEGRAVRAADSSTGHSPAGGSSTGDNSIGDGSTGDSPIGNSVIGNSPIGNSPIVP